MAFQRKIDSGLRELALFAGAGGGILGGKLLGWRTVCAVERDAYARDVLVARQNDGCLAPFPIWDDVCTFDGRPWRGRVDVVSGGFPCQDISVAGKGVGITGERSGLWGEMRRIIGEVRPQFVFVENSPALTLRGAGRVTGDLAALGYLGSNGVLGAVHAGAPHKRERIWFVAHAESLGSGSRLCENDAQPPAHCGGSVAHSTGSQDHPERGNCECQRAAMGRQEQTPQQNERPSDYNGPCRCGGDVSDADRPGLEKHRFPVSDVAQHQTPECGDWWRSEPAVGRVAHGVAARVDRLRCLGNGQVPAVVPLAWHLLTHSQSA